MSITGQPLYDGNGNLLNPITKINSVLNGEGTGPFKTIIESDVTSEDNAYVIFDGGFVIQWGHLLSNEAAYATVTLSKTRTAYRVITNAEYYGEYSGNGLGAVTTSNVQNYSDRPINAVVVIYFRKWTNGVLSPTTEPIWGSYISLGHI